MKVRRPGLGRVEVSAGNTYSYAGINRIRFKGFAFGSISGQISRPPLRFVIV